MTVTFVSNYINHHQIPFCDALYRELKEDFRFVQTRPMEEERLAMGWSEGGTALPYVHCLYEEEELCRELILNGDILLAGWSEREDLIGERLKQEKPVLRISERLYREGQWKAVSPRGLIQKYKEHTRYRRKQVYLLCAGAYVPSDFHLVGAYPDKMYRFGYFPETRHYTEEEFANLKEDDGKIHIVWAARFIPLKHPEYMIYLAGALKEQKKPFCIHMVGSGDMEEEMKALAVREQVAEYVRFHGFLPPEEVRRIMEKSHIQVFTSSYLEGWGAVVNEGMNSGCAVVANVQAGAVPYLIEHEKNGLIYPDNDLEKMKACVLRLFEKEKERESLARAAYETITRLWNAEHAAGEVIGFAEQVLQGVMYPRVPEKGPMSRAEIIAPRKMYKKITD